MIFTSKCKCCLGPCVQFLGFVHKCTRCRALLRPTGALVQPTAYKAAVGLLWAVMGFIYRVHLCTTGAEPDHSLIGVENVFILSL